MAGERTQQTGDRPARRERQHAARKGGRRARPRPNTARNGGKLRIGDHWNAITIIALSQNSPLKAIAEFVENAIDARATSITIIRGRENGEQYLRVVDDGQGIQLNQAGVPDFDYVATHICDSIKRTLKSQGATGIQGEFGIGLLSFWTVGERMVLSSGGADGRMYDMVMHKGEQRYQLVKRRTLFAESGTELMIKPLLPGIRQLTAERIQSFLADELRDRIQRAGVHIRIRDRRTRKELDVVPRQFTGRPLSGVGPVETPEGMVVAELYVSGQDAANRVGLFRQGTRVVADIGQLPGLDREPWTSGYLQGLVDAPFLQLTPGTRDGVVQDGRYAAFYEALEQIEPTVLEVLERERAAVEEETSRSVLRSVRKALSEGMLALPSGDYDWLEGPISRPGAGDVGARELTSSAGEERAGQQADRVAGGESLLDPMPPAAGADASADAAPAPERAFHEYPGPLHKLTVSPATMVVRVGESCNLRCIPRDRKGLAVDVGVRVTWQIVDGAGALRDSDQEQVTFLAPNEPGLTVLRVTAFQDDLQCTADATITVTEQIGERLDTPPTSATGKGIPAYTFHTAAGELWRSRFDAHRNLIIINNGHADYRFAPQKRARKLRYILRLYAKELVLHNFPGFDRGELLERMIELSLYTEEHLR